jgi:hypothetical protein
MEGASLCLSPLASRELVPQLWTDLQEKQARIYMHLPLQLYGPAYRASVYI